MPQVPSVFMHKDESWSLVNGPQVSPVVIGVHEPASNVDSVLATDGDVVVEHLLLVWRLVAALVILRELVWHTGHVKQALLRKVHVDNECHEEDNYVIEYVDHNAEQPVS